MKRKTVKIVEDEGICPECGGILKGYVGIEGEWPCECDLEADRDRMIDGQIDEYLMRKKGIET